MERSLAAGYLESVISARGRVHAMSSSISRAAMNRAGLPVAFLVMLILLLRAAAGMLLRRVETEGQGGRSARQGPRHLRGSPGHGIFFLVAPILDAGDRSTGRSSGSFFSSGYSGEGSVSRNYVFLDPAGETFQRRCFPRIGLRCPGENRVSEAGDEKGWPREPTTFFLYHIVKGGHGRRRGTGSRRRLYHRRVRRGRDRDYTELISYVERVHSASFELTPRPSWSSTADRPARGWPAWT